MDWKKIKSKFSGTMTREKWLLLLAAGILLMILSLPPAAGTDKEKRGKISTGAWDRRRERRTEMREKKERNIFRMKAREASPYGKKSAEWKIAG